MSHPRNRQITLKSRPTGMPAPENFELTSADMPIASAGQVLVQTLVLSLDPYMRGRISDAKNYAAPVAIGEVVVGGTVGRVVESHAPPALTVIHISARPPTTMRTLVRDNDRMAATSRP